MTSWHALRARMSRFSWVASYSLETSRESHAAHGSYLRSAACCVGLAALRLMGSGA